MKFETYHDDMMRVIVWRGEPMICGYISMMELGGVSSWGLV